MVCGQVRAEATDPGVAGFEKTLLQARPLDISHVRLLGGPLKQAQDLDAEYLLKLEPDRMMAGYRLRAGLQPKAEGYGGWDSVNGKQLTGHIAGHYLSAVSLMYAATGDARFKERADYLVKEMKEVQDKRGNGYCGALTDNQGTDAETLFQQVSQGNIRSGGFDLNGMWSPWYTLHKTYAGLRDAWRYTGNKTALEVEIKFAAWAEGIVSKLTDAQIQRMLNTEFGGMNEIFADLYADTGDKRWLDLSYKFEHRSFIDPLKRHQDNLDGKHGNTQVPKLIGSADRFAYTGDAADIMAAGFFWDRVVAAPQLRHRRPWQGRILRQSRRAERPRRRPHRRDLQRLQHAQADPPAVRAAARCALRRFPRAGPVQPHPRLHRPQRRPDLLHGARRSRRAARVPGHVPQSSPAASAQAWRATHCTATGSTTNPATSSG